MLNAPIDIAEVAAAIVYRAECAVSAASRADRCPAATLASHVAWSELWDARKDLARVFRVADGIRNERAIEGVV